MTHHKGRFHSDRTFTTDQRVKIGWCDACDKCIYLSRKTARIAARRFPANRPRAYRCPTTDGWWHAGHLPDDVRHGEFDRPEYRRRKGLA